jgi:TonB family protein
MPENILVVEQEPTYADRVRQALAGQGFIPSFVNDGDQALQAIDREHPKLIVLSDAALIRTIRSHRSGEQTPILLTVADYNGSAPKQDATALGASDILRKPYSESEFLGKVQQMLPRAHAASGPLTEHHSEYTVRHANVPRLSEGGTQLTSREIFGDLLADDHARAGMKKAIHSKDDVDKLLADTLSGVRPGKKKDGTGPGTTPAPAAPPKPKTQPGNRDIDKMLADLTMTRRPKPATPPPAAPAAEVRAPTSQPAQAPQPAVPEEEPRDGVRFGQYVLLEKIATGGMAEVWKARMRGVEGFQKIVAIKKILPHLSDNQEFIAMFVDEAKLAAQLNHNNIIHIYDLGKIQASYYIAMEFVDGYDLKSILRQAQERDQPLTVDLALFIASKVAAALDYAHRKRDFDGHDLGLVHRDVSPQNVLISHEGDIKLCDFGIAKAASKASHTQAGALKGKLQYMAPEQAWGRNIDRRSDIFALAAVLFELLTGRKLFAGENEMSVLEQVRQARVTPPSTFNEELTPEIDAVVLKGLQKDPANRYQTAAEMARDLDVILYNFKPTPTSADLAIYMHRLRSAAPVPVAAPAPQPVPPPVAEKKPAPAPAVAASAVPMPSWDAGPAAREKKAPIIPIAIAAAVVIAVAVGAFMMMRNRGASAPQPAAPTRAAITPPVSSATAATASAAPTTSATVAPSTQPPALDPARVDEEVRKRLAAQRAKLEEQARAQEAAAQPQPRQLPLLTRNVPPPTQTQPAPQPAAPPPSVVDNRPTPVETATTMQPQPAPQPVTQTVAPAPAPAPVEPQRVREGDLVPSDTEGLVLARMVRRANVPYPPIAKMQRVEGTVLVSALVDETGKVLETRIIRPIPRPVGLNEAADQIVRRSIFSPPTKDGVRVKAWTTVPVDFKL